MIEITDRDIDDIEQVMGLDFDSERREVIKCLDRRDVQACPGSGKTTALVAKLGILCQKVKGNQGICTLSHTNVARTEIQTRLRKRAGLLLDYPHFIGTIQSFVDRFLAIPAMIEMYGIRPWIIDDEVFEDAIEEQRQYLPRKVKYPLDQAPNRIGRLACLRYSFENRSLCWLIDGDQQHYLKDPETPTYQALHNLKEKISRSGIIAYHDAYALANEYLNKYPDLARVISVRFPYVFVDEAQDTDKYQWELLQKIFNDEVVLQCVGDQNQAIYNFSSSQDDLGWAVHPDPLRLNRTFRLSTSISQLCENIAGERQKIEGNTKHKQCRHTIFLFDNPATVVPAFAELIKYENLNDLDYPCKVVGMRKSHDTELSLQSYHSTFFKSGRKPEEQDSLSAYFALARESAFEHRAGEAQRWLQQGIVKLARLQEMKDGKRTYTSTTLLNAWRAMGGGIIETYQEAVLNWIDVFVEDRELIREQVVDSLKRLFSVLIEDDDWTWTQPAKEFLSSSTSPRREAAKSAENCYKANGFDINIDTIHGVKGETHAATMLVETFNRTNHLKKLLPYLLGNRPSGANMAFLRLAYVAMTRPSHLLCLAMRKTDVSDRNIKELVNLGWFIEKI